MENKTNFRTYIYLWLALSVFFLYSHLLELFPNASQWLLNTPQLSLTQFDTHSATYLCVAFMSQLLLGGILLDKFGIRLLTILAALLCLLGAYLFVHTNQDFKALQLCSRILVTAGIAYVIVSSTKVISNTMPTYQLALMSGLFLVIILLDASFADTFNVEGKFYHTWRQVISLFCAGTLILAMLFSILCGSCKSLAIKSTWIEIRRALQNRQNWLLAAYSGLSVAPIVILAGFAGKPFFEEAYAYTNQEVFILGGFLLLGLTIGAPLTAYIASAIHRRRALMQAGILIQEITFIPLIYLHHLPFWLSASLLLLLGLAGSVFILSFIIGKEINQTNVGGTIISVIKIGIIAIAGITLQIFGKFLTWDWDGKIINGIRYFSTFDYHVAFTIFPVYLLLGYILLLFINEPSY